MYAPRKGTLGKWAYEFPSVTGIIEDTPAWGQVRMSAPGANFSLLGTPEMLAELAAMDGEKVTVYGAYEAGNAGYRVVSWGSEEAAPPTPNGNGEPPPSNGDPPPTEEQNGGEPDNGGAPEESVTGEPVPTALYAAAGIVALGLLLGRARSRR